MAKIHDYVRNLRGMRKELNLAQKKIARLQTELAELRRSTEGLFDRQKGIETPDSMEVPMDARYVGKVTATSYNGDSNFVQCTLVWISGSGSADWEANDVDTDTYIVAAPNHNFSVDDIIDFFWNGNWGGSPVYHAAHVSPASGGGSAAVYTVTGNSVTGGVYVCDPGSVSVVNFEEKGDSTHALVVGTELLGWDVSGTIYGVTRYAKTKS